MKHAEKTINGKYIINGVLTYSELDQEGGEVYSLMWATLTYNLWRLLCCGGGGGYIFLHPPQLYGEAITIV